MSARVGVREGKVYLSAATVAMYFAGVEAVIVLIRDGAIEILPVRHLASGGCLLKRRNAAGDRVAAAPDVFRDRGLGDWRDPDLAGRWDDYRAALIVALPQGAKKVCTLTKI